MAGDFRRFGEAAGGSRRNGESSTRAPSSVKSFAYKATPPCVVTSFSFVPSPLQQTREIPVEVVWW
jgi:hypothetical protein